MARSNTWSPPAGQTPVHVDQQIAQNPTLLGNLQQQGQGWLNQAGQYGQQMGDVAGGLANWNAQNPFMQQQQSALNQMAGGGFNPQQLQDFQNMFNPNTGQPGGGAPPPGMPYAPGAGGGGLPGYQGGGGQPGGTQTGGFNPYAGGGQPQPQPGGMGGMQDYLQQQQGGGAPGGMPFAPGAGSSLQGLQTDPGVSAQAAAGGFLSAGQGGQALPQAGGGYDPYSNFGRGRTQQPQQGGGAPGGQVGGGQPQQPTNGGGAPGGGGASNPFGVGLNQAAGPSTTTGFTGTPTTVPSPGAGGQYNAAMLGGGQQAAGQFGGFGADVGTAQQAQLGGLLNQAQAPGMNQAQQDQMFASQYDPAKQAINEAQNRALAQGSARGMGRSSALVGNVEGERMQALGSAAQQAGANVTGQNLALGQRQSEFGLGGLGQFAGQGMQGALGAGSLQNQMQGTANQMNLGMGNIGLGTEQQNMQAQQQQFQQDNARAGMDLARYQTEQGFNMDQYKTDLNAAVQSGQLDEQTAARMAQNALQTTQQGLQAQGMQNQANQAYMNAALGAGGQALDYSGQNLQGQMAGGGMYGNAMGQFGGMGMDAYQMQQDFLGQITQNQWQAYQNQYDRNAKKSAAAWGAVGDAAGNIPW